MTQTPFLIRFDVDFFVDLLYRRQFVVGQNNPTCRDVVDLDCGFVARLLYSFRFVASSSMSST